MEAKAHVLEQKLSKSILEEELLKSENIMLEKQVSRLKKLETCSEMKKQVEMKDNNEKRKKNEKKQKIRQKILLTQQKIHNCLETISKYKKILIKLDGNVQEETKRKGLITEIKCQQCSKIFKPNEYFLHFEEGCFNQNDFNHSNTNKTQRKFSQIIR